MAVREPSAKKWFKTAEGARDALMLEILLAFEQQRDPIADSDLDDEQPIRLSVLTRLGFIRRVRRLYDPAATALAPSINVEG